MDTMLYFIRIVDTCDYFQFEATLGRFVISSGLVSYALTTVQRYGCKIDHARHT